MARIRLYDFPLSGNAHKVRNLLALLGVDYERVPVDLAAGEQRTRAFEDLNPFRQVPVLVDGATVVRDSSAILVYLARKFGRGAWLPVDAEGEARVQEWLATASTAIADGPDGLVTRPRRRSLWRHPASVFGLTPSCSA